MNIQNFSANYYNSPVFTCWTHISSIRISYLIILIFSIALLHQTFKQVVSRLTLKSVSFVKSPHNLFLKKKKKNLFKGKGVKNHMKKSSCLDDDNVISPVGWLLACVVLSSLFCQLQTMCPDVFHGPWGGSHCRDSPVQTIRKCSCAPGPNGYGVRGRTDRVKGQKG